METQILLGANGVKLRSERGAAAACQAAKELENIGEYDRARAELAPFWTLIDERPQIEGLAPEDQAEMLLRAGALAGWLGSSGQVARAQQFAKDLISESIRAFEGLGYSEKVAEAQTDLALCYWREGAMDEARVWFQSALAEAKEPATQLRILVNSTTVEVSSNHLDEALAILNQAASLLDSIKDNAALGRFYMHRAPQKGRGGEPRPRVDGPHHRPSLFRKRQSPALHGSRGKQHGLKSPGTLPL